MTFFRRIVQLIRSKVIQLITLAERRINTATNFLLIALSLSLCLVFALCILVLILGKSIYKNPFATFVLYFWLASTGLFVSGILLSVFLSLIKILVQFHIYGVISILKSIALKITSTIRLLLAVLKLLVASPRILIKILVFLANFAYYTTRMLIRIYRKNPKEIFKILVRELRWALHTSISKKSYISPELSESLGSMSLP